MDFQDDAAEFSSEDVDTIVKNAITGCLTDVMYNPKKVRTDNSTTMTSKRLAHRVRVLTYVVGRATYRLLLKFGVDLTCDLAIRGVSCEVSVGEDLLLAVTIEKAAINGDQRYPDPYDIPPSMYLRIYFL